MMRMGVCSFLPASCRKTAVGTTEEANGISTGARLIAATVSFAYITVGTRIQSRGRFVYFTFAIARL